MPGAQTDAIARDLSDLAIWLGQVLLYNVQGTRRSAPPSCSGLLTPTEHPLPS